MNRVKLRFTRPTPDLPSSCYECYTFIMIKIIICFELHLCGDVINTFYHKIGIHYSIKCIDLKTQLAQQTRRPSNISGVIS